MLVRTFEILILEIRKRIGQHAAYRTRSYRSYDRLREHIELMEDLYHTYRKIKRSSVNLFK